MAGLLENQGAASVLNSEQMAIFKDGYQQAKQILFDKEVFDAMMEDVQSMPAEDGVAHAVVSILMTIQQQNGRMDLMVALALGISLLGEVVDALRQIGMDVPDEIVEQAFGKAIQMFLSATSGQYSKEEMAEVFNYGGGPEGQQPPVGAQAGGMVGGM